MIHTIFYCSSIIIFYLNIHIGLSLQASNCLRTQKIAYGRDVEANQYPPLVKVQTAKDRYCSGIAIHPSLVLTAAHCITNKFVHEVRATPTHISVGLNSQQPESRYASKLCRHPKRKAHDKTTYEWDIGVVKLREPFDDLRFFTITDETPEMGKIVTVAGFGLGNPGLFAQCTSAKRVECLGGEFGARVCYLPLDVESPPEKQPRICHGDAGGPIFIQRETKLHLVGLVSDRGNCTDINDAMDRNFGAFDLGQKSVRESVWKLADECLAEECIPRGLQFI